MSDNDGWGWKRMRPVVPFKPNYIFLHDPKTQLWGVFWAMTGRIIAQGPFITATHAAEEQKNAATVHWTARRLRGETT